MELQKVQRTTLTMKEAAEYQEYLIGQSINQ